MWVVLEGYSSPERVGNESHAHVGDVPGRCLSLSKLGYFRELTRKSPDPPAPKPCWFSELARVRTGEYVSPGASQPLIGPQIGSE